jgi:protoporphyrinogen oxidase
MRGGFYVLIEAMEKAVTEHGGKIIKGTVSHIEVKDGRAEGVVIDGKLFDCDSIISTVAPQVLEKMMDTCIPSLSLEINYQGTACAIFGLLEHVMDDVYWLNIRGELPFGAVIEHTNFIPASDYGEHLMYVTSYFQNSENLLWRSSEEEVIEIYLGGLEKLFPGFRKKMKWWRLRRDVETAPVYETGYGKKLLPYETAIKGLYLAGMFSEANYPERSMNGSIKAGFKCAESVKRRLEKFNEGK